MTTNIYSDYISLPQQRHPQEQSYPTIPLSQHQSHPLNPSYQQHSYTQLSSPQQPITSNYPPLSQHQSHPLNLSHQQHSYTQLSSPQQPATSNHPPLSQQQNYPPIPLPQQPITSNYPPLSQYQSHPLNPLPQQQNYPPIPLPQQPATSLPIRPASPDDYTCVYPELSARVTTTSQNIIGSAPLDLQNVALQPKPLPLISFSQYIQAICRNILEKTNLLNRMYTELNNHFKANFRTPGETHYPQARYGDIDPFTHNLSSSSNVNYPSNQIGPKHPFGINCIQSRHPDYPIILATESPVINAHLTNPTNEANYYSAAKDAFSPLAPFAHFWWNMIDMGIEHIFMLTSLSEKQSDGTMAIKAEKYWPSENEIFRCFNHDGSLYFEIRLASNQTPSTELFSNNTFDITINERDSNNTYVFLKTFQIHHHQCLSWADRSAPDDLKKIIEEASSYKGNIAVQCSAGVGRTGTFIAALQLKHFLAPRVATDCLGTFNYSSTTRFSPTELPETSNVALTTLAEKTLAGDLLELVSEIRVQRSIHMVQTFAQFEALFTLGKNLIQGELKQTPPNQLPPPRYARINTTTHAANANTTTNTHADILNLIQVKVDLPRSYNHQNSL